MTDPFNQSKSLRLPGSGFCGVSGVLIVLHLKEERKSKERNRISFRGVRGEKTPGGGIVMETSSPILLLRKVGRTR